MFVTLQRRREVERGTLLSKTPIYRNGHRLIERGGEARVAATLKQRACYSDILLAGLETLAAECGIRRGSFRGLRGWRINQHRSEGRLLSEEHTDQESQQIFERLNERTLVCTSCGRNKWSVNPHRPALIVPESVAGLQKLKYTPVVLLTCRHWAFTQLYAALPILGGRG